MNNIHSGSGPGEQTSDGCSVELYRQLPYMGELEAIIEDLREQPALLELGCGTGRMSRVLAKHGINVSGVDESAEMLAHLPTEVEGLCSSIETLTLDRRWPVVLLASNLINHPDPTARQSLMEAAFRHASPGGDLYVQRHDVDWLASAVPGKVGEFAGIAVYTESIHREWPYVTMTHRYEASGDVWRQYFTAEALYSGQVESVLYEVGFDDVRWCGESRLWARARKSGT